VLVHPKLGSDASAILKFRFAFANAAVLFARMAVTPGGATVMFARKPCTFASAFVRSSTAVAAGGFFVAIVGNSAMLPSWFAMGLASRSASCAEKMGLGSAMPSNALISVSVNCVPRIPAPTWVAAVELEHLSGLGVVAAWRELSGTATAQATKRRDAGKNNMAEIEETRKEKQKGRNKGKRTCGYGYTET